MTGAETNFGRAIAANRRLSPSRVWEVATRTTLTRSRQYAELHLFQDSRKWRSAGWRAAPCRKEKMTVQNHQ